MVIAIDLDDTLGDFSSAFIKFIKKTRKHDVDIHDLAVEEWWRAWGDDQKSANETIYEFLYSEDAGRMRPKIGAVRALKILKQAGHQLYIITGRPFKVHELTKKWVADNLPAVFEDIFCTDFHIVNHGAETKGSIAARISAKILIDDYPGYAQECLARGIKVLLMESFWNNGYEAPAGVEKVENWQTVLRKIA